MKKQKLNVRNLAPISLSLAFLIFSGCGIAKSNGIIGKGSANQRGSTHDIDSQTKSNLENLIQYGNCTNATGTENNISTLMRLGPTDATSYWISNCGKDASGKGSVRGSLVFQINKSGDSYATFYWDYFTDDKCQTVNSSDPTYEINYTINTRSTVAATTIELFATEIEENKGMCSVIDLSNNDQTLAFRSSPSFDWQRQF